MDIDEAGGLVVGLDIDTPCYEFTDSLAHFLVTHKGYDPAALVRRDQHNHWLQWPLSEDEWWAAYREAVQMGVIFSHSPPVLGAVKIVSDLQAAGHQVWLITARYVQGLETLVQQQTEQYFQDWDLHPDRLIITTNKAVPGVDWLVDDLKQHLQEAQTTGTKTILWRCAHNVEDRWPLEAASWADVRRIFQTHGVLPRPA